jgi:hypothetical protein
LIAIENAHDFFKMMDISCKFEAQATQAIMLMLPQLQATALDPKTSVACCRMLCVILNVAPHEM